VSLICGRGDRVDVRGGHGSPRWSVAVPAERVLACRGAQAPWPHPGPARPGYGRHAWASIADRARRDRHHRRHRPAHRGRSTDGSARSPGSATTLSPWPPPKRH